MIDNDDMLEYPVPNCSQRANILLRLPGAAAGVG